MSKKVSIYPPEKAVDGVYLSSLSIRKCQHTDVPATNESAWWQIEYDHPVLVHSIDLYNRVDDCCGERLNNANIYVFEDGVEGTRQYCGTTDEDMSNKRYIKIICPEALVGNVVRVESPPGTVVTLCEVDIYGALFIQVSVRLYSLSRNCLLYTSPSPRDS